MTLTDEQIEQFREIYRNNFGKEISKDEAYDQATRLLRLIMLIYKPMSLEQYEAIQKRRLETMPEILQNIAEHAEEDMK